MLHATQAYEGLPDIKTQLRHTAHYALYCLVAAKFS